MISKTRGDEILVYIGPSYVSSTTWIDVLALLFAPPCKVGLSPAYIEAHRTYLICVSIYRQTNRHLGHTFNLKVLLVRLHRALQYIRLGRLLKTIIWVNIDLALVFIVDVVMARTKKSCSTRWEPVVNSIQRRIQAWAGRQHLRDSKLSQKIICWRRIGM